MTTMFGTQHANVQSSQLNNSMVRIVKEGRTEEEEEALTVMPGSPSLPGSPVLPTSPIAP